MNTKQRDSLRRRQLGEGIVVLAFLALAGLVFQQTRTNFVDQGAASGGAMFNAAMFPELLGWCLVALAVLRIVGIIRASTATQTIAGEATPAPNRADGRKALACAGLFVVYLVLLKPLGYHLMTPAFMFGCFYVLGTRSIVLAAALAIGISLAMSFVFEFLMRVILPVGMFGIGF